MDDKKALYHHGILGMKWGVRRYQNPDGSLTPEGKERYRDPETMTTKEITDANTRAAQIKSYKKNYPSPSQKRKEKAKERLKKSAEVRRKAKSVSESYANVADKTANLLDVLPKNVSDDTKNLGRARAITALKSGAAALNLIGAMQGVSASVADLRAERIR